ncbi:MULTISPECIES: hypothetical protein [Candidatus Ichthyocystis]|nr:MULTISPECIES: hypothetical protein [Ichthyocystis]
MITTPNTILSTITKSPKLTTAETTSSNETNITIVVVIVTFIFFAIAIFSFLGYKTCKVNKSHQPISRAGNVNPEEEQENLV